MGRISVNEGPALERNGVARHPMGWQAGVWLLVMLAGCGGAPPVMRPPEPVPVRPMEAVIPRDDLAVLVDTFLVGAPDARRAAGDSLDRLDDPRTPAILLDRLHDPAFRHEASRALMRLGVASGVDSLLTGLADTDAFVRWSVATALGAQGLARFGPLLVVLLDDTAMAVRRAAAFSLGQLADTTFLPALVSHRNDPAEEVRAAIAEALGQYGPQAAPILRAMVEEDSGLVVTSSLRALGRLGLVDMVPVIGVALLDGPIPTRMAASEALGRISGPAADSLLLAAALEDPEPLVRESAVQALGHSNPVLVLAVWNGRHAREPDSFVRTAWVDALDRLPGQQASEALRRLSEEDVSPDVRRAAKAALLFRESTGEHR